MKITYTHLIKLAYIIVFILSYTFLRKTLLIIYPFIVLALAYLFKFRIDGNGLFILLFIISISLFSSFVNGFWLLNNALSLYILIPSIFLCLAKPKLKIKNFSFVLEYWKYSTFILIIVNVTCIFTFAYAHVQHSFIAPLPMDILDDSFYGLYGKSGLGAHILSGINAIYAVKYFFDKKKKIALLFFIFSVLGFYGLGLVLTLVSLALVFRTKIVNKRNIKVAFSAMILVVIATGVIKVVNPDNYNYIKRTLLSFTEVSEYSYSKEIQKAKELKTTRTPRKITLFVGVFHRIIENPAILLLGTSPGTYNSRVAYLLNGDLSKTAFLRNNFTNRSKYHTEDIFPLYNTKVLVVPWMGGTRNHPFSSIVSIFMEYGFFVGLLIFWILLSQSRRVLALCSSAAESNTVKFVSILTSLLFLFVFYLELIEYMLPMLLLYKSYELDADT